MSRTVFLILQALHILLYSVAVTRGNFIGMAGSGGIVVVLYGLLLYREIRYKQWAATPLAAYLVVSMIRVGLGSIYLAAAYWGGYSAEMEFITFDAESFAAQGHLLLMAGDWLLLAGYFAIDYLMRRRETRTSLSLEQGWARLAPMGLFLVMIGWTLRLGVAFGANLTAVGQFGGMLMQYAVPAGVFLLAVEAGRNRGGGRVSLYGIVSVIVAVQLAVAMRSYMKTDVMVVLLPLAVYFGERMKATGFRKFIRWQRAVPLILVAYFVTMILFPYNGIRRGLIQQYGQAPVTSVLYRVLDSAIPFTDAFNEAHAFPNNGAWAFMRRNEWTTAAAWAVERVDSEGTVSGETLQNGFVAIVPRVFWPGKPLISPGVHFAVLMGQARSFETATSATGLGLAATLYWNGGAFTLVAGMLLNGVIFALTWHVIRPQILTNPVATIVYFMVIHESLRWFESQFDGSLAFYAYIWIVFVPLMYLVQAVGPASWRISRTVRPAVPG